MGRLARVRSSAGGLTSSALSGRGTGAVRQALRRQATKGCTCGRRGTVESLFSFGFFCFDFVILVSFVLFTFTFLLFTFTFLLFIFTFFFYFFTCLLFKISNRYFDLVNRSSKISGYLNISYRLSYCQIIPQ